MHPDFPPVDLIEELRLRCWARQHYISAEFRSADWHPIILEEMEFKDQEPAQTATTRKSTTNLVPLQPGAMYIVHEAHQTVIKEPHFLKKPEFVNHGEEEMEIFQQW